MESSLWAPGKVAVVLGAQWGDEGKGKLVDILAQQADVVVRCQGGSNAGHTIVVDGKSFDFHMLPSGVVNPRCTSLVGNGVVLHLRTLFDEIAKTESKGVSCAGRVLVSDRAHLVFDMHQVVDGLREKERGDSSIGTTRKGIGPAYSAKASRSGLRVHHLLQDFESFAARLRAFADTRRKRYGELVTRNAQGEEIEYCVEEEINRHREYADRLRGMVVDSVEFLHRECLQTPISHRTQAQAAPKRVLVEGANAAMLDLDFGTYPFVTSSSTTVGGVCTGLGVPARAVGEVIGVAKAYTTRVGGGPFPTELTDETGERLQRVGAEVGVTTGRKRRCGWLDAVVVRYSAMLNGFTSLNLTKLDVLTGLKTLRIGVAYVSPKDGRRIEAAFPADLDFLASCAVEYEDLPGWDCSISACRTWEELPEAARAYVRRVEELVCVPVTWVGVGPGRSAILNVPRAEQAGDSL